MSVPPGIIQENLRRVTQRIDLACRRAGRSPTSVKLVVVTKSVGLNEIRTLINLGITDFGENRVHVAQPKIEALRAESIQWHMIGTVQRRKAADVVRLFDTIDSVDRIELAEALDRRRPPSEHKLPVLVEVNVSGEASKHGIQPSQLEETLDKFANLQNLALQGLMTMAPRVQDPQDARPYFAELRNLGHRFGLQELSMGMSGDFDIAVEEGATQIRVGSALFVK